MSEKVIIIAEAGVNHNGVYENAIKLIEAAATAGADYVKFQTFKADKIVSKSAQKADYQIQNLNDHTGTQHEMLKKLEMPIDWYESLIDRANQLGIKFLSTGFDEESIDFLERWNPDFYKIPSGEITNKPYLQHVAGKRKPIILSTGMADIQEVKTAVEILINQGISKEKITVLHCNTEYPTPMEDVNLLAMIYIRNELNINVGYSDHTLGIEVPIAAVALGAKVIEKHFTIDRTLSGPDHAASLESHELTDLVKAIRNIEKAISGSGIKEPSKSEIPNKQIARKSIHINSDLHAGHILSKNDFVMLRPGDGISPMEMDRLVGKEIMVDINLGEKLQWKHLRD